VRRLLTVAVAILVLAAACSAGPAAPPVTGETSICDDVACLTYPDGWEVVEVGDTFIRFTHPADPEHLHATISPTNMEGVVTEAGGTWPALPADAVRAFWALLEETGAGRLGALRPVPGGIRSVGTYGKGRMWFLLLPTDATHAIGVEVRAPNRSWETHADVFFSHVTTLP